jgi:tRNA dimethylallyltransferase
VTARRPQLLVIVGPTASGKSALAHAVALHRRGEIVSADAFAVYRGLDVGTAKPTPAERAAVRYHAIDVADPDEAYSAGRWQKEARRAVEEISARGRLPIVCGGSGFYVSALLSGLPAGEARDLALRSALEKWGRGRAAAAHRFLAVNDPVAARRIAPRNVRYTLRALEILLVSGEGPSRRLGGPDRWAESFRVVKVGLAPSREDLYARIARRVHEMLEAGWREEVRRLLDQGISRDSNAFQAIGYREIAESLTEGSNDSETERKIVTATRRLAKRQKTWLARETDVTWLTSEEALPAILALLDAGTERRG